MNKLSKILLVIIILLVIALIITINICLKYRKDAYDNLNLFLEKTDAEWKANIRIQELEDQLKNVPTSDEK